MNAAPDILKKRALHAGLLFFVWMLSGLFDLMYLPGQINTRGDGSAVAQNVLSKEFLFRIGILNNLFSAAIWVILVLLLYRLFKAADKHYARLLVALVLVQIPVGLMMGAFRIASLLIFKGKILTAFESAQRLDLALAFLKMNDYGILLLETFWGLWLFPLAILVYKSRLLPRFLGVWLGINGLAYLAMSVAGLLFPEQAGSVYKMVFPLLFGEMAFMVGLLVVGFKGYRLYTKPAT